MARRTIKEIMKDMSPKEIEVAQALFENDLQPKGKRKSYAELADSVGLGLRTLYDWRQKDAVIEYQHALSAKFEASARARVMRSVIEGADEGNAAMAKLYLQTMGMLANTNINITEDTAKVDRDEIKRKLDALRERI